MAKHWDTRFNKIAKLSGFSSTLTPGIAIKDTLGASRTIPDIQPSASQASPMSLNPSPIRSPSPNLPIIHPCASSSIATSNAIISSSPSQPMSLNYSVPTLLSNELQTRLPPHILLPLPHSLATISTKLSGTMTIHDSEQTSLPLPNNPHLHHPPQQTTGGYDLDSDISSSSEDDEDDTYEGGEEHNINDWELEFSALCIAEDT